MRTLQLDGLRALENPIDKGQAVDPVITDLVLGTPTPRFYPSERILPLKTAPKWSFQYTRYDNAHIVRHDTRRAMRAPIRLGDFQGETETAKLDRFSFGVTRDVDELQNTDDHFRLRERSAIYSRRVVRLDCEARAAALLTNTATYHADNALTLASGDEWNDGGDSRADVRLILKSLRAKTALPWEAFTVWLSGASLEAALEDANFLANRSNYTADTPDLAALARYWGVKEVWSSTVLLADTAASDPFDPYGDSAIIYYDGGDTSLDVDFGDIVFGHTFTWNGGVASVPWYEEKETSWVFPWTEYRQPLALMNKAAGIIKNTAIPLE